MLLDYNLKRNGQYLTLDTLFEDIFPENRKVMNDKRNFVPANDIVETDDDYTVELMLPGFIKEDFKISTDKNVLTIKGERVHDKDVKYTLKQSYYGEFNKSYTLPDDVRISKIDAEYINGVLYVTIPKDVKKIKNRSIVVK